MNVLAVCELRVSPDQEGFVSPNAWSIAEAYVRPEAKPFAIVVREEPVGFVMLYDDGQLPVVGLWRMMVDYRSQRQGVGASAVRLVIDRARQSDRNVRTIQVGAIPGVGGPGPFYEWLGFTPTGEVRQDGEVRYELHI
jgi:diamine N-acetyltransferase